MRSDHSARASSPYHLAAAIAFCALVGLYDIVYVIALNLSDTRFALSLKPVVSAPTIYPDFITPYAATQAYFKGLQSVVYDPARFTAFLNELYAYRFDFKFQPFLYPPVWALALLPFGLLPVYAACLVFMVATAAASAFQMRRSLWSWLAIATSPAAVWVVLSGQNTFLYIALIYGGMRLVETSPVAGGILLGCLVYKPQICLLVPLALLASRQWQALASMIATGTAIVLASVAVFGFDFWLAYLDMTLRLTDPSMVDFWASRRSTFQISPFVAARILLLPDSVAKLLQLSTAVLGAGAVWFAFRRFPASAARTAVLMTATLLASPYSINYDLMLLLPVALLLYRQGAATGFYPLEPLLYAVLWLMPTAILWFNDRAPLTPVVVLAFGLFALLRLRDPGRTNTA